MGPPTMGAAVTDRQQLVHQPVPADLWQQNWLEQRPLPFDQRAERGGVRISQ